MHFGRQHRCHLLEKKKRKKKKVSLMLLSGSRWASRTKYFLCTPTVGTKDMVQIAKISEIIMLSKIWSRWVARSMSSGVKWLSCTLLQGESSGPHIQPEASFPPFSWSDTRIGVGLSFHYSCIPEQTITIQRPVINLHTRFSNST